MTENAYATLSVAKCQCKGESVFVSVFNTNKHLDERSGSSSNICFFHNLPVSALKQGSVWKAPHIAGRGVDQERVNEAREVLNLVWVLPFLHPPQLLLPQRKAGAPAFLTCFSLLPPIPGPAPVHLCQ